MPEASPLKASPAAAIPGNDPSASVPFHIPITGIAFAVETKPCSSSAVTSIVYERLPLIENVDHKVCPSEHSNPAHQPPGATVAGAASVPSPPVLHVLAAPLVDRNDNPAA